MVTEWEVHCPNCGAFYKVGKRPKICPKCDEHDIITMYYRYDIAWRQKAERMDANLVKEE